jgi:hypothetical protein
MMLRKIKEADDEVSLYVFLRLWNKLCQLSLQSFMIDETSAVELFLPLLCPGNSSPVIKMEILQLLNQHLPSGEAHLDKKESPVAALLLRSPLFEELLKECSTFGHFQCFGGSRTVLLQSYEDLDNVCNVSSIKENRLSSVAALLLVKACASVAIVGEFRHFEVKKKH